MEEETNENVAGSRIEGTRKCDERTSSPFIIYQIHTTITGNNEEEKVYQVERRFSQFLWLERQLVIEYPSCIIPPLPGKNVESKFDLSPFDRFDQRLIEKRKITLNRFLNFVTKHYLLSNSKSLKLFLVQVTLPLELYRPNDGFVECLNEKVAQLFSKTSLFCEEKIITKQKEIKNMEILFIRLLTPLEASHKHLKKWSKKILTIGMQADEPIEGFPKRLEQKINSWGSVLKEESRETDELILKAEQDLALALKDCLNYCRNALFCIRSFEAKQEEREKVKRLTQELKHEKELVNQQPHSNSSNKFISFCHRAVDSFKGISIDDKRQKSLLKLEIKLEELTEICQRVETEYDADLRILLKDIDIFIGNVDELLEGMFIKYAHSQLKYCSNSQQRWNSMNRAE